jgi:hypothetical protein
MKVNGEGKMEMTGKRRGEECKKGLDMRKEERRRREGEEKEKRWAGHYLLSVHTVHVVRTYSTCSPYIQYMLSVRTVHAVRTCHAQSEGIAPGLGVGHAV